MPIFKNTCAQCQAEFESRKNKKFCTKKCYFISLQNPEVEIVCKQCEKHFLVPYRGRAAIYCSRTCAAKNRSDKKYELWITKNCAQCKKEMKMIQSRKSAKFCSLDCKHAHMRDGLPAEVEIICENCDKTTKVPYAKRKKRFCSRKCSNTGVNNGMFGKSEKSFWLGKPAWNSGQTIETSAKLAALGRKISKIQKEKFKKGTRSNVGKNNPNFGKTPKDRTPEQLNNYSKAATKRVRDGVSCRNTSFKSGYYTSKKNGETMWHRSSWELRTMKCLDADPDIENYSFETVLIRYGEHRERRYLVDFDIQTKNGQRILLEVKPAALVKNKTVILKTMAAREYAEKSEAEFRFCTLKDIKAWEARLELA